MSHGRNMKKKKLYVSYVLICYDMFWSYIVCTSISMQINKFNIKSIFISRIFIISTMMTEITNLHNKGGQTLYLFVL